MGRSLCFIGDPGPDKVGLFGVFAGAGLNVLDMTRKSSIVGELEANPPAAVVLGEGLDDRRAIIASLQERSSLRQVPILCKIKTPDQASMEAAFRDGADDFLFEGARAQLAALAEVIEKTEIPQSVKSPNGLVVVAEENRVERTRLGRLLKRNGFDIHFAADLAELQKSLDELEPRAVVTSATLPGGSLSKAIIESGEKIYEAPPWLVIKTDEAPDKLKELASISAPETTVVFDKGQDAERLTFLMNEILTPPPPNVRRSARLLYGTPVVFHKEGRDDLFYGYSYNINLDGLFIRTITPLEAQDVVELRFSPPFGRGDTVVSGEVRWRKGLGSSIGSSSPVGMGIQFTKWAQADKAGYREGYRLLLQEHRLANPRLALRTGEENDEK